MELLKYDVPELPHNVTRVNEKHVAGKKVISKESRSNILNDRLKYINFLCRNSLDRLPAHSN